MINRKSIVNSPDDRLRQFNRMPIPITNQSLLANDPPPLDVRRKETERWCKAASTQWYKSNEQQHTNMSRRPVPPNNPPLPDVQRKEMDRRCKAASRQWYVGEQQPLDLSKELPSSNDPPPLDMRSEQHTSELQSD